jgi:uncharacterized membrane protein
MTFALVLVFLFLLLSLPPLARRASLRARVDRAAVAAGLFFIVAGALHFARPAPYDAMIPPFLSSPRFWTYLSGAAEVAGGVGMLLPRWRRYSALGLVVLLLAVLPANIHVAVASVQLAELPMPRWYFWARIPFQLVYVAWVAWAGRLLARGSPVARTRAA